MREIKFRAWDNERKEMILNAFYVRGYHVLDKIPGSTLMQYSGLKDKNGIEIYEGDVLCCPHYPSNGSWHYLYHKVMWDERLSLFKTVSIGNREGEEITAHGNPMLWVYLKSEKEAEVIGNIYEHPELLKQELSS